MPTHLGIKPVFKLRYSYKQPNYKHLGTPARTRNLNRGVLSELHANKGVSTSSKLVNNKRRKTRKNRK